MALVTNEGQEIVLEAEGVDIDIRGSLPPPIGDSGWCYYFVRVVQEDENMAWSSPIWLDTPDSA